MAFKCHICKKVFMNNIEFMKHLHLHVESDRATAIDLADLTQCKYCYKAQFPRYSALPLKETVPRDFRIKFFHISVAPKPLSMPLVPYRTFRKLAEIFADQGA
jgi:hypothetical protein